MKLYFQSINLPHKNPAQPLILLHGLFGSGDNWGTVAQHFAAHRPVISVDLRNHGRSPHHVSQTYTEMAEDVLELCDVQGWESIQLLGHSLGGKVAMQFANLYPSRITKLIVVDIAMRAYADVHTPLMEAMLALDVQQMPNRSAVDKALTATIPDQMVRQFLLTNLVKVNDHLQWRLNLTALKANYPQLQSAVYPDAPIHIPTLFISGAHSDYMQAHDLAEITQTFTQAQFISLPTGHWVHAEQPQLFCQVVSDFIDV